MESTDIALPTCWLLPSNRVTVALPVAFTSLMFKKAVASMSLLVSSASALIYDSALATLKSANTSSFAS
jgi:hypothetical protein